MNGLIRCLRPEGARLHRRQAETVCPQAVL